MIEIKKQALMQILGIHTNKEGGNRDVVRRCSI